MTQKKSPGKQTLKKVIILQSVKQLAKAVEIQILRCRQRMKNQKLEFTRQSCIWQLLLGFISSVKIIPQPGYVRDYYENRNLQCQIHHKNSANDSNIRDYGSQRQSAIYERKGESGISHRVQTKIMGMIPSTSHCEDLLIHLQEQRHKNF